MIYYANDQFIITHEYNNWEYIKGNSTTKILEYLNHKITIDNKRQKYRRTNCHSDHGRRIYQNERKKLYHYKNIEYQNGNKDRNLK